jgi:hypothetical protein
MNILQLLQADNIEAIHATSGGEYHSPCPECGGRDRFSTWPERANSNGRFMGGRFCCRGCGWFGDAVSYLQKRRGLSFRDACNRLNIEPGSATTGHRQPAGWQPEAPPAAPGEQWQERARAFLDYCQKQLAADQPAIDWLQAERGLTAETVKAAGLGWNPADIFDSRQAWGLPEQINDKTGKTRRQWLPGGLVIPSIVDGQLLRLRIRREKADQFGRYVMLSGSSKQAMTLWVDQPAVCILESELDGLLVGQEAGDLIGVIALGSAQQKPDSGLHARLMNTERILLCLDADEAGANAAAFWTRYPGCKRWPTITGKDCTEQMRAGIPIEQWIEAGLT